MKTLVRSLSSFGVLALLVALPALSQACVFATTVTWTGNVNSDWNNSANYSAVPASGDIVVVDPANFTGAAASPVIAANSTFNPYRVSVQNGASLAVQADLTTANRMQVTGSGSKITQSAGIVSVSGAARDLDIQSGGEYEMSGGTLNCRDLDIQSSTAIFDFNGGTANVNRNLLVAGELEIASAGISGVGTNTFQQSGGNTTITGTQTFPPSFETVSMLGGTVNYAGTTQDVAHQSGGAITYYNLTISGSGSKNMTGDINVARSLTIDGGTLSATASDFNLAVGFTFTNNMGKSGFDAANGTVILNGSAAQLLDGSTNFYDLTINNAAGVTINSGIDSLQGTLTLTSGNLATSGSLVFQSTATETARLAEITGGSISGDVTVLRHMAIAADDWRTLSSPVSGLTLHDWNDDMTTTGFSGANWPLFSFTSIYTYDETDPGDRDQGWKAPGTIGDGIAVGDGYMAYLGSDVTVIDVVGPVNTGLIDLGVSFTDDPSEADSEDGWNLVGNPYPSTLDWDAATGWTKTNVEDAVYVWNPAAGQWASYIKGSGSNGGSRYIAHSQGFWVKTNAASPSLQVDEPAKVAQDATFIKSAGAANQLVLKVAGNGYEDETIILPRADANEQFEGNRDAWKLRSMLDEAPMLATRAQGGEELSINALPYDNGRMTVPLQALNFSGTASSFTIELDAVATTAGISCLVLEDLETGQVTDLLETSYTFTQQSGSTNARFLLHIAEPLEAAATHIGCSGATEGAVFLEADGNGPWTFSYADEFGTALNSHLSVIGTDSLAGLQAGVYNYTIEDHNDFSSCSMRHGQIVVEDSYFFEATAESQPVSCSNLTDGEATLTVSGGAAPFAYAWSNGQDGEQLTNLAAGAYDVLVTDANGCQTGVAISIAPAAELVASFAAPATIVLAEGGVFEPQNSSVGATTYFWDFGNGSISTEVAPTQVYAEPGTYTVTLQASNTDCMSETTFELVVVESLTSIDEPSEAASLSLSRQGGVWGVNVELAATENVEIRVTDYSGRQVVAPSKQALKAGRIELPNLPTGVYLVQVSYGNASHALKLVNASR